MSLLVQTTTNHFGIHCYRNLHSSLDDGTGNYKQIDTVSGVFLKYAEHQHYEVFTVSVLGREEGYTVKYSPLPEGVPEGEARRNSQRQRGIFDRISRVKSLYEQ